MHNPVRDYPKLEVIRRVFCLLASEGAAGPAVTPILIGHVLAAIVGGEPHRNGIFFREHVHRLMGEGLCEPGPMVGDLKTYRAPGTAGSARPYGKKARGEAARLVRYYNYVSGGGTGTRVASTTWPAGLKS